MEVYDVTILGAGPVGLFAAFYAGMRKRKIKVIDSLDQVGGQLAALYPEKVIYDIPGQPEIAAGTLIKNLEQQLTKFPVTYALGQRVENYREEGDLLAIETDQEIHYTKTLILATGQGSFAPRKLTVPGADTFEGRGISYFVTAPEQYRKQRVLIAGGGDSALDWALSLESLGAEVGLVHRRDKFRAHEYQVENLEKSGVKRYTPYVIAELHGDTRLRQVTLIHKKTGEQVILPTDELLVNYGFVTDRKSHWPLEQDTAGITVSSNMATSFPGVFACGDAASYPGKVNLIATGFGEAATAVNNAVAFLDPSSRRQPAHSTSLFA